MIACLPYFHGKQAVHKLLINFLIAFVYSENRHPLRFLEWNTHGCQDSTCISFRGVMGKKCSKVILDTSAIQNVKCYPCYSFLNDVHSRPRSQFTQCLLNIVI